MIEVPLTRLTPDFPLEPSLASNLVPSTINLWFGCSRDGTSSGLHHDFHDNIYALCRGRKRFRLWPPRFTERLYPTGKPVKMWPNGRIVYKGQGSVGADGADDEARSTWEAEEAVHAAEEAAKWGEAGAEERVEEANRRLDAVLDEALLCSEAWQDDFDLMDGGAFAASSVNGEWMISCCVRDIQEWGSQPS